MKAEYYAITIQADPNTPGGIYDFDMCVKSCEDLENVFVNQKERLIAFLMDDLKTSSGKQMYITGVEHLTKEEAWEGYDLTSEAYWPVFGATTIKGSRRRYLPKLAGGAVKGCGGQFEIDPSHDPDYPGVDIEFNVVGNKDRYNPRVVVEQTEGHHDQIRVLIWADPDKEDYTDKVIIDLKRWV